MSVVRRLSGASTRRARDVGLLIAAVAVIVVTAIPMTRMLAGGWEAEGLGYTLVYRAVAVLPVGIDGVIVFLAGIPLGLLLVFLLDRSKVVQALLLVLAGVLVAGTLWMRGVWFAGSVDWIGNLPLGVAGAAVGVLSGVADRLVARVSSGVEPLGVGSREFPLAAVGIFVVVAVVGAFGFLDMHVLNPSSLPRALLHLSATVVFLGVVGLFLQYTDRRDVVLLSPDREAETLVICGLYDYVRDRYETVPAEGADELNNLAGNLESGGVVVPADSDMSFYFKPPGWFSRWISISTAGYEDSHLLDGHLDKLASRTADRDGPLSRLATDVGRSLRHSIGRSRPVDFVERLLTFDVVLLLVPLSDPAIDPAFDPARDDERVGRVGYIGRYRRLSENLRDAGITLAVVGVDGEVALEYFEEVYESTHVGAPELRDETSHRLALLAGDEGPESDPLPCDVFVLSRERATDRDPSLVGIGNLLDGILGD